MNKEPRLIDLRRADAIVGRVRVFAGLFAVLTVAWIALDALLLEGYSLALLASLRVAAGTMFAVLALCCRKPAPTLAQARNRLTALLLVPTALFLVSQSILPASFDGWQHSVSSSYAFFPFILAAGIGAFPLTLAEIVAAGVTLVAVEVAALSWNGIAAAHGGPEMVWLLLLIEGAAGFAAVSQMRLLQALIEQATRDPLTGCLRRESGAQLLELQFALAHRHRAPLAVLFADIDRFKRVNDAFGHEAGDRVLAATAEAFRAVARETDTLIRWGGEEFVLVLPHTGGAEALALVERLGRRGLGGLPDKLPVTVTIGIAHYPGDTAGEAHELVAVADQRMYLAKQAGRNRCVADASGEPRLIVAPPGEPVAPLPIVA
jgi:diguanylate cyclase (GGDEF)-like protein